MVWFWTMFALLFAFLTSFLLSFLSVPSIIRISRKKHLFDEPDARKCHLPKTPTLGGISIFGSIIFSLTFWSNQQLILELQFILASLMILFFAGVKDDLLTVRAHKKLLVQICAAIIIVHWTDIRLTSFFGLFGLDEMNVVESYSLSVLTIVAITNAFNLIDGIDGLAASIGIFVSFVFGAWFT